MVHERADTDTATTYDAPTASDIQFVSANEPALLTQRIGIGVYERTRGMLQDIFMPAGYPSSVSSDYLNYQIFDSLQAFSSSIAGLLASRAVLEGFGVGDASASATTALLINIAQDAISRLATILCAWRLGTSLEPESKKYRLLADIFNDTSMILDCLSPLLPSKSIRVFILCTSGAFRALCGVAAGGAKAALSIHFAKANNVGDLNAKDSSQETVIGLLGMLAGSIIIKRVTTPVTTWAFLITLLALHIFMNYLAVRSVVMHTLNRQRLTLTYSTFRKLRNNENENVQTPAQIAKEEFIFARGGRLYDYTSQKTTLAGTAYLGYCSFEDFHDSISAPQHEMTRLFQLFSKDKYILTCSNGPGSSESLKIRIYLREDAVSEDSLRAWIHAVELAHQIRDASASGYSLGDDIAHMIGKTYQTLSRTYPNFFEALKRQGWELENNSLLTSRVTRFRIVSSNIDSDTYRKESKKDI